MESVLESHGPRECVEMTELQRTKRESIQVLLMAHSKPYVRKKAVSAMFKLFVKYPQGLRLTFDRLKERLARSTGVGKKKKDPKKKKKKVSTSVSRAQPGWNEKKRKKKR